MDALELLRLAADALRRRQTPTDARVEQLLEALEYGCAWLPEESDAITASHRIAWLELAGRFEAIFHIDSPYAPGLAFFGGVIRPALAGPLHTDAEAVSVSGRGMTLKAAFEGCVGEAVEFISQLEREGDAPIVRSAEFGLGALDNSARRELGKWLKQAGGTGRRIEWLNATRLSDNAAVFLPADFCLRRPPERRALEPPFLLGTGAAAATTPEAATTHAVLELIERDALGLWWKGGNPGFEVDRDLSQSNLTLAALRRGRDDRETWLLDIATDMHTPCIVAVSCGFNGKEFAFGVAARMSLADAARVALLELCQMELALDVVRRKRRERGADALNAADRRRLALAEGVNARACELLRPRPGPRSLADAPRTLPEVVRHAAKLGIEFHQIDLTRQPEAIPAVRVIAPALQLEPSRIVSDRLRNVIAKTGGGERHTDGVELL